MAESMTATFKSFDGNRATVILDGAEKELRMVGSYLPQSGDIVRVRRDETGVFIDGLATPREPTATILGSRFREGTTDQVVFDVRTTDNRTQTVEALDHVQRPAPGDVVVLFANYIIGRLSAAPTEGDTP